MKRKGMGKRRRRDAGTAGALLRAALLFGPLGAVLALALIAGSQDRPQSVFAQEGIDGMVTGSVGPARVLPSNRGLLDPPNGGPCLVFPDGSERGSC